MSLLALLLLSLAVCDGLRQLDAEDLFPVDDLTTANPDGYAMFGTTVNSNFGFKGINLGDINGDGLDDLMFSHLAYGETGRVIVVFGDDDPDKTSMTADTAASSSGGFNITIEGDGMYIGSQFATGDFNGDDRTDILIGCSDVSSDAFAVVLLGPVDNAWTDIVVSSAMDSSVGVLFSSGVSLEYFGKSVVGLGDFNNDTYDDFAIGAPYATSTRGKVYVVFGGPTLSTTVLDSSNSLILSGPKSNAGFGGFMATGDFNNDSHPDLVVDASVYPSDAGYDVGRVYVIFGGDPSLDVGAEDMAEFVVSDTTGMYIDGDIQSRKFGTNVDSGCDVNGDGIDDIIIGSVTSGLDAPGIATVLFGKTSGFKTLHVASLDPEDGFVLSGNDPKNSDQFGQSVGFLGYVDDDEYCDFFVDQTTSDYYDAVTVFYGRADMTNSTILEEEPYSQDLLNTDIAFNGGNHLGDNTSSLVFAASSDRTYMGSVYIIKDFPSIFITQNPTMNPTMSPSESPSASPTASPTSSPTTSPTSSPTTSPTSSPTDSPTTSPTAAPTISQCDVSVTTTGGAGLSWDVTDDEGDEEVASGEFGGAEVEFTLIASEEYLLFLSSATVPAGSTITVTVNEEETVIPLDGVTAATEIAGVTCESITNKIASIDSAYSVATTGLLALFMAFV